MQLNWSRVFLELFPKKISALIFRDPFLTPKKPTQSQRSASKMRSYCVLSLFSFRPAKFQKIPPNHEFEILNSNMVQTQKSNRSDNMMGMLWMVP